MRKFEIEHLKERVNQVTRCTNGTISTKLNARVKGTGLTDPRKLEMIKQSRAVLKEELHLSVTKIYGGRTYLQALFECYDFPVTEGQQEKIDYNKTLTDRIIELHDEVTMEGKRIIDDAILGIIETKEIPIRLQELGRMTSLA